MITVYNYMLLYLLTYESIHPVRHKIQTTCRIPPSCFCTDGDDYSISKSDLHLCNHWRRIFEYFNEIQDGDRLPNGILLCLIFIFDE